MEFWNDLTTLLSMRVEALGISAAKIPVALVIAALLLPILLTALARQLLAFFSVLLVICGLLAIDPSSASAGALAAAGAYIASVLMGVMAVVAAFRNRRIAAELARLRADLDRVIQAEERRLIETLKARSNPRAETAAPTAAAVTPITPPLAESPAVQPDLRKPEPEAAAPLQPDVILMPPPDDPVPPTPPAGVTPPQDRDSGRI